MFEVGEAFGENGICMRCGLIFGVISWCLSVEVRGQ